MVPRLRVREDAIRKGLCDLLTIPGILAEVSTVSNDEEARHLKDPEYRQQIAEALSKGILAYAEARNHPPPSKRS